MSDVKTFLEELSESYNDGTKLRSLVQLIPYVGGSLDTLMGASGQKRRYNRVIDFLLELDCQIKKIQNQLLEKNKEKIAVIVNSEEFYDSFLYAVEQSIKTRHKYKKTILAKILANQISQTIEWDDSEMLMRLIAALTINHIQIIKVIMESSVCEEPFKGFNVIIVDRKGIPDDWKNIDKIIKLVDIFKDIESDLLKFYCSELVAMGLLKDEGAGRWGTPFMTFFRPTGACKLLYSSLKEVL